MRLHVSDINNFNAFRKQIKQSDNIMTLSGIISTINTFRKPKAYCKKTSKKTDFFKKSVFFYYK